jgi:hypothetical protein
MASACLDPSRRRDQLKRSLDGKLKGNETPEAQRDNVMRRDTNEDSAITFEEVKRLQRRVAAVV